MSVPAVELFSQAELRALLDVSRRNNSRVGITGMLLYKEGNFMQVLEGPAMAVREVHERIQHDPRHTGLITLMERSGTQRQFADWSMGFRNLADPDLRAFPGYNEFLNVPFKDAFLASEPTRVNRLLQFFREKL